MDTSVPVSHTLPRQLPAEPAAERYLRHIRNWVAFMGVVLILSLAAAVAAGVLAAGGLGRSAQLVPASTQPGDSSSICLSQGGSDASC